MKNAINYYYNLSPNVIHQTGKVYKFSVEGYFYILTPFDLVDEIRDIYDLSNILLQRGVYCHQIILNSSNQLLTKINNILYVLMKVFVDINKKITVNDVILFNNIGLIANEKNKLKRNDWFTLWVNKVDYFEYQVNQLGKKYPLIRESFSYFVGLAENAIWLYKNTQVGTTTLTISHRRIRVEDTLYDLYNPLNMIIDNKIRDICEYFKSAFFYDSISQMDIMSYLYYSNLNNYECILFFARMMFPSYYFDIYEKIMSNHGTEEELKLIINKINDYEVFLANLYQYFKNVTNFPEIEWIKK